MALVPYGEVWYEEGKGGWETIQIHSCTCGYAHMDRYMDVYTQTLCPHLSCLDSFGSWHLLPKRSDSSETFAVILHAAQLCFSLALRLRYFIFKCDCVNNLTAILIFWSQPGNHKAEFFPGAATLDTSPKWQYCCAWWGVWVGLGLLFFTSWSKHLKY